MRAARRVERQGGSGSPCKALVVIGGRTARNVMARKGTETGRGRPAKGFDETRGAKNFGWCGECSSRLGQSYGKGSAGVGRDIRNHSLSLGGGLHPVVCSDPPTEVAIKPEGCNSVAELVVQGDRLTHRSLIIR